MQRGRHGSVKLLLLDYECEVICYKAVGITAYHKGSMLSIDTFLSFANNRRCVLECWQMIAFHNDPSAGK